MTEYVVNPRGGFLSVGPGNLRFWICSKTIRVGLRLGPSDLGFDCAKA